MSVDSKLFVVCKQEEKMSVVKKVLETLYALACKRLREKADETGVMGWRIQKESDFYGHYSFGATIDSRDFELFTINFGVGDENGRMVWVHTTCDCDVAPYLPEGMGAVIISLGCWGSNMLIIDTIANVLKSFGDVYIDYNDCDDVEYARVD